MSHRLCQRHLTAVKANNSEETKTVRNNSYISRDRPEVNKKIVLYKN